MRSSLKERRGYQWSVTVVKTLSKLVEEMELVAQEVSLRNLFHDPLKGEMVGANATRSPSYPRPGSKLLRRPISISEIDPETQDVSLDLPHRRWGQPPLPIGSKLSVMGPGKFWSHQLGQGQKAWLAAGSVSPWSVAKQHWAVADVEVVVGFAISSFEEELSAAHVTVIPDDMGLMALRAMSLRLLIRWTRVWRYLFCGAPGMLKYVARAQIYAILKAHLRMKRRTNELRLVAPSCQLCRRI